MSLTEQHDTVVCHFYRPESCGARGAVCQYFSLDYLEHGGETSSISLQPPLMTMSFVNIDAWISMYAWQLSWRRYKTRFIARLRRGRL